VVEACGGGPLQQEPYRRGIPHCRIRCDVARPITLPGVHNDLRERAGMIRRDRMDSLHGMAGMPFVLASTLSELTRIPVACEVLSPYYCVPVARAPALRRLIERFGCFFATSAMDAAHQCEVCGLPPGSAPISPLSVDTEACGVRASPSSASQVNLRGFEPFCRLAAIRRPVPAQTQQG
jgi:hypothetical protein